MSRFLGCKLPLLRVTISPTPPYLFGAVHFAAGSYGYLRAGNIPAKML